MDLQMYHTFLLHLVLVFVCSWNNAVDGCEVACFPPSNTPPAHSTSEEMAVAEGRCYTACLERYRDYIPQSYYINYKNWSAVSFAVLESRTCGHLQRVMECKESCVSRLHTIYATDNICRDDCYGKCQAECGTGNCTYDIPVNCSRLCRKTACRIGCEEFSHNFGVNTQGNEPIDPSLPLQLSPTSNAGVYTVQLSSQNSPTSPLMILTPASFVFRVEENGNFEYFWKPSLSEELQLSSYSCRNVNISFAAVNKNGISAYSPLQSFCINGEYHYPQQVSKVGFAYTEDHRPEFLSHAVVNISWEKPEDAEYLTGYEIMIIPFTSSCGGLERMVTISDISKDTKWITHTSQIPGDPAKFGCRYFVKVISLPMMPGASSHSTEMRPALTSAAPNLTLTCQETFHPNKTITINVAWSTEEFSDVVTAVERFNIDLQVTSVDSTTADIISSSQFPVKANESGYIYTSALLQPFVGVDKGYTILVTPIKNLSYFWRPIPRQVECFINGTIPPEPPSTITAISVHSSNTSFLNASWAPPSLPYGTIVMYEVIVGENPVNHETDTTDHYTQLVSGNSTTKILYSSEIMRQSSCNYLQVRSHNGYSWSSWSEPVSLSGLQLSCMITSSTPAPTPASTTPLLNPSTTPASSVVYTMQSPMTPPTPVQTSVTPVHTDPADSVMYLVYGLSAFTGLLLVLSMVFLIVLVAMRCTRIREDKISSMESNSEVSSLKKSPPVEIVSLRKATNNIYDSFPTLTSTASSPSDIKPPEILTLSTASHETSM